MKVIADLCIVPMGVKASVSEYVAECQKVLCGHDLLVEMHANGTNIEGELMIIAKAIEDCYNALYKMGVPRVFTTLIMSCRNDKEQTMQDKIDAVTQKQKDHQT